MKEYNYGQEPKPSDKSPRTKKGLKAGDKINLTHVAIALLGLLLAAYLAFKPKKDDSNKPKKEDSNKTDPCAALKKKEELTIKKIADLVKGRENSTNKDSIEIHYDFEITYTNAELKVIKDSLKSCTD